MEEQRSPWKSFDAHSFEMMVKYIPRISTRETSVNGYIRKLPDGQHASDEARERAKKLGYELALDETYVAPFIKRVLFLRPEEDPSE